MLPHMVKLHDRPSFTAIPTAMDPVELLLNLLRTAPKKRVTQKRNPLYLNDIVVGLPGVEPGTNGL
jgi:hypothetical protein